MSARYEITLCDTRVEITDPWGCVLTIYDGAHEMTAGAIRQQSADIAELSAVVVLLTHKVICCGVAASHPNAALTTTGAYADKWDSPQAESVRKLRAERDQLRAELAAVVGERDRIKGDHDEAAHFARHFIRDDPGITPRGAIIRLGDKCTDLFCRLQSAEQERDQLRARLAAIDQTTGELCSVCGWRTILAWGCEKCERDKLSKRIDAIECQPAIARIESLPGPKGGAYLYIMGVDAPPNVSSGTELIARPAKDSP